MKVQQLREALADLPDDMDVIAPLCISPAHWRVLTREWKDHLARQVTILAQQGKTMDMQGLEFSESSYSTIGNTGRQMDVTFVSVSEPDFERNRIALEF